MTFSSPLANVQAEVNFDLGRGDRNHSNCRSIINPICFIRESEFSTWSLFCSSFNPFVASAAQRRLDSLKSS